MELLHTFKDFVNQVNANYFHHWYLIALAVLIWHYLIQGFIYRMFGGNKPLYNAYAETFLLSLPFVHRYRLQAAKNFFFCGKTSYIESGVDCILITNRGTWSSAEFSEMLAQNNTKVLRQISSTYHFGRDFFVLTPILAFLLAVVTPMAIILVPLVALIIAAWALVDYTFKLGPFKSKR